MSYRPQFLPGDRVEYCGDEATVVDNFGSSGDVRDDAGNTMQWYWEFQGTRVTLVKNTRQSRERSNAMLDLLKNFDANRLDMEQLVELSAEARKMASEYEALKVEVPEWLGIQTKSLRREIASRDADRKERALRDLKARRSTLKTVDEKRTELDKQIADLESQVTA